MADFVNAIDPDGNPVKLPNTNAQAAFADGFRPESPEETAEREARAKYGDSEGRAFAEGLGRGATFGLTDWAQAKLGVPAEDLKGRQKYNPISSTAGDLTGAVGTMFIPGAGAFSAGGLAAKAGATGARVAAGLGEGLVGRAVTRGLASGIEGGLFGIGSAISEDVLEDGNLDLAGEKLVSHVGMGALLGAGGAALGVGLEGAGAGAKRLLGRAVTEGADDVAAKAAGLVDDAGEAANLATEAAPTAKRFGLDVEDIPDDKALTGLVEKHAPTVKGILEKVGLEFPTPEKLVLRDLDITGAQVGKLKAKGVEKTAARAILDDARYAEAKTLDQKLALINTKKDEAAQAIGESVSKFDELAKEGERFNPIEAANRIDEEVIEPLKGKTTLNEPTIEKLRAESRRLRQLGQERGNELSYREAEEFKRSLDPFLKWDSAEPGAMKDALRQVRGIVNSEIENGVEAIAVREGSLSHLDDWKGAKRLYGEMAELEKHAAKRAAARDGNRYFSLTDYLAGNAGATIGAGIAGANALADGDLGVDDLAIAGAGMLANKWARERLSHVLALYFDKASKGGALSVAAKAFEKIYKKAEAVAPEAAATVTADGAATGAAVENVAAKAAPFGKYGSILATAATKGANALFATHAALATVDPGYRDQMEADGFKQESPMEADAHMKRAGQLDGLQQALAKHDENMDKAITGFLANSGRLSSREPKAVNLKDHSDRLEKLAELATNPEALAEHVKTGLAEPAPGVAGVIAGTAARAVSFLHNKAPKDPNPPTLPGLERDWSPSDLELATWSRFVRAVNNPRSVLEDMQRGTVTKEAVEALQAVYPQLVGDVQRRIISSMADKKRPYSYSQRLALASLFGKPVETTTAPAAMAEFQAIHGVAQEQQRQTQSGQRMKTTNGNTFSQRIESRGQQ